MVNVKIVKMNVKVIMIVRPAGVVWQVHVKIVTILEVVARPRKKNVLHKVVQTRNVVVNNVWHCLVVLYANACMQMVNGCVSTHNFNYIF